MKSKEQQDVINPEELPVPTLHEQYHALAVNNRGGVQLVATSDDLALVMARALMALPQATTKEVVIKPHGAPMDAAFVMKRWTA